jgi:hypothetical protein
MKKNSKRSTKKKTTLSPEVKALLASAQAMMSWVRRLQALGANLGVGEQGDEKPILDRMEQAIQRVAKGQSSDPKTTYEVVSPTGARIIGTSDLIPGTALARVTMTNGVLDIEPSGETKIHWCAQETEQRDGEDLYEDEYGDTWKGSELLPGDPIK